MIEFTQMWAIAPGKKTVMGSTVKANYDKVKQGTRENVIDFKRAPNLGCKGNKTFWNHEQRVRDRILEGQRRLRKRNF